ncbi:T7SS effector LXG polymorphic toxin [Streptococcus oralis]|uniref:T7SS effector LXG polymorphic toxin n=1 Tax=Streptococcus oralis TaxID=1303 RepID=UPI001EFCABB0|nr:T7SS effector LXG polymorphic toxin [Streptococcus oralis]
MKIDVSEVRVQKELLVISVNSIKEQLSVSRSRLSEVVSTDSLKGAVKDAINQKVTNYQIPLVDNYDNALDSIVSRYDELVKLFQDTVSETDNNAIIKTEYLERIKQRMKDPIEGLKSSSSKTKNIYAGISDILTLTNPSLDSMALELKLKLKLPALRRKGILAGEMIATISMQNFLDLHIQLRQMQAAKLVFLLIGKEN